MHAHYLTDLPLSRTHASPQTCHPSASDAHAVRITCRVIAVFLFRKPLFAVIMAPKHKSSDAGSASEPKRSCDVLSISRKVKILDMIEIEKNRLQRLPGCVYKRERKYAINVQCSVQYNLLLHYLMLVMSYCA